MNIDGSHRHDRVLVLGAGFIGSHIVRALGDRGYEVVVQTRHQPNPYARSLLRGARLIVGDSGDRASLEEALQGTQHVVFAIGSLMPGEASTTPELDVSLLMRPLVNLLELLVAEGPRPVIFISSGGTVYGRPTLFPTREDYPAAPLTPYGITRIMAERYIEGYADLQSTQVRNIRVANAYGPGQSVTRGQGVIATALDCCLNDRAFSLFGDGQASRDFVHVEDVAGAVADLIGIDVGPSTINIGSGSCIAIGDLLEQVRRITGRSIAIEQLPGRDFDLPKVHLDIDRLKSLIAFEPRSLAVGISATWRHLITWQADDPSPAMKSGHP